MYTKSEAAFQRAQQVIPGGVNSPVRAFRGVGGTPPFIARGEGSHIFDIDGNEYIDYVGSWGPLLLGHRHPAIVEAVRQALETGTSFGAPTEREIDLAEAIRDAVPSMEMVRLVNSGTEATMSAIRVARGFTGRDLTVKFEGCYHGHVDSLLVKAGSGLATLGIADTQGVPKGFTDTTLALPFNSVDAVEAAFRAHGDRIASVIVEPVVGNMGCVPPLPGFLEALREITARHGALLILDEVMTGFRVAFGGAQARFGIRPDMTTLGKVIGGGSAHRRLRRTRRYHELRGAGRADLSGRHAVGQSAGGGRGPGHAAIFEGASGSVRELEATSAAIVRRRARGHHGEPGGGHVHLVFHGPAGDGLGFGQARGYDQVCGVPSPHAGAKASICRLRNSKPRSCRPRTRTRISPRPTRPRKKRFWNHRWTRMNTDKWSATAFICVYLCPSVVSFPDGI